MGGGQSSFQKKLFQSVKDNDIAGCEEALVSGASPNYSISEWKNIWRDHPKKPLHMACEHGNIEIVKLLLKYGADPNVLTEYTESPDIERNITPLHISCFLGHTRIVKLLLMYGAHVNAATEWLEDQEWRRGWTGLHIAAVKGYSHLIKVLLKHEVFINATTESLLWTPLHYACSQGHADTVQILVSNGANVNAKNKDDKTPDMLTADSTIVRICKMARVKASAARKTPSRGMKKSVSAYSMPSHRYGFLQN